MNRFLPVVVASIVLVLWWALAAKLPPVLLPSPAEVAITAVERAELLGAATWTTAISAIAGLSIALGVGLLGGVLFLVSPWIERALYPYALLVQTVPVVAIAPLLVVWLDYGIGVAVTTAAIVSFFPILTSTNLGLRAAPPEMLELLRIYDASWRAQLFKLRIPVALPYVFSGLRSAVGLAVIGAIVGEFVGSNGQPASLGYVVLRSSRSAETGLTFAAIACATVLALIAFGGARLLERRVIGKWHGERT